MVKYQTALVALVIAMLGISAIYFYAASVKPVAMAPGDIKASDEGTLVKVEGVIGHPYIGNTTTAFDLVDPATGGSVKVFVAFDLTKDVKAALRPGARAQVQGDVKNYKDRPEIEVKDHSGLRIVAPPEANDVRLDVIAGNKEAFDNMTVSVRGTVKDLKASWGDLNFSLYDGQFKALCRVHDFSPQVPFKDGSTVRLVGRVWSDDAGYVHIKASGWGAITVEI